MNSLAVYDPLDLYPTVLSKTWVQRLRTMHNLSIIANSKVKTLCGESGKRFQIKRLLFDSKYKSIGENSWM